MAINIKPEQKDAIRWLQLGKRIFLGCVVYGIVVGFVFHALSLEGTLPSEIVLILDYPGLVTFFVLEGILAPYGNSLGLLSPSIIAWTMIGAIPYALARFKVAIE